MLSDIMKFLEGYKTKLGLIAFGAVAILHFFGVIVPHEADVVKAIEMWTGYGIYDKLHRMNPNA